jgi:hypothetical protein
MFKTNIVDTFPTKILISENLELAEKLLPLCNKYTEITETTLLDIPNYPSTLRNEKLNKQINSEPIVIEAFDYIEKLIKEYTGKSFVSWEASAHGNENYGFFSSMNKGAFLRKHKHLHCTYSGLIYLEVGENVPSLIMHNPNPFDYGTIKIEAIKGRVLMWPCWLEHELEMKMNDNPRKVFSFNV